MRQHTFMTQKFENSLLICLRKACWFGEMAQYPYRMANILKINSNKQVVQFKRDREFKAMGTLGGETGFFQGLGRSLWIWPLCGGAANRGADSVLLLLLQWSREVSGNNFPINTPECISTH